MPEIAEVARIVHYLKKHVVGKTISAVRANEDDIVYGKTGTTAAAFQKAITGKAVVDARQQGKYFWLVMSSPPHPLMHFGMTGWIELSNDNTHYNEPTKPKDQEWPPRFWKFILEMDGADKCEAAFVDKRRLARIRLVDADGEKMRQTTPLKENGPDPLVDPDVLTEEWLITRLRMKKVPIKAYLLDQGNISGVGNWVADEVLYQARIHPEQYCNTLKDAQIKQLHDSLISVCKTAVDCLADKNKFPGDWLMKYRWDMGKKDANVLPNGAKIIHLKVGGRTSAVVPSVQKKTGAVAGDISKADLDDGENGDAGGSPPPPKPKRGRNKPTVKDEMHSDVQDEKVESSPPKRRKTTKAAVANKKSTSAKDEQDSGRRRSARIRG